MWFDRRLVCCLALLLCAAPVFAAPAEGRAYVGSKPVDNAVVWLDAPDAPKPGKKQHALMDQRNMTFIPHVLAVRTGTVVDFPNNDRVFHNVFSYKDGKRFDLGLYPVGSKKEIHFDRAGLSRLFCNIHPHMAAYIMVVDTPYFGVSNTKGELTLQDPPAGEYTYHAWRPGGKEISGKVTVQAGKPIEVRWP